MKAKDLKQEANEKITEEAREFVIEQIRIREKEIKRMKKLLTQAKKEYEEFLEQDIDDIIEDLEFEY